MDAALPFLHPALGAAALGAAVVLASLGFQGRRRRDPGDLSRHARLGPYVLALIALSWAAGLATVVFARRDLAAAESLHFSIGSAILVLFVVSALTARWIDSSIVRALHPWIGAAALLLCGVQTVLGLGLLP